MKLKHLKYIAAAAIAGYIAVGLYSGLSIGRYVYHSKKVTGSVRIALVTDLHSCAYGEDMEKLVKALDSLEPDIVCMCGDTFDDTLPDNNTAVFLARVAPNYPCYYVTGNHEYWKGHLAFDEKMSILERYGVTRLSGESRKVEINGTVLNLCGIDDRDSRYISQYIPNYRPFSEQLSDVSESMSDSELNILLSHRPELIDMYSGCGFDLVLAGHAHGGQWRVPGLLGNGLVAPDQGLFPKYTGGVYQQGRTTMIVSRGLARESTSIPRFYNRPELVLVELTGEE